jgi:hypothetical protein
MEIYMTEIEEYKYPGYYAYIYKTVNKYHIGSTFLNSKVEWLNLLKTTEIVWLEYNNMDTYYRITKKLTELNTEEESIW